jgi:hypothetical protein
MRFGSSFCLFDPFKTLLKAGNFFLMEIIGFFILRFKRVLNGKFPKEKEKNWKIKN